MTELEPQVDVYAFSKPAGCQTWCRTTKCKVLNNAKLWEILKSYFQSVGITNGWNYKQVCRVNLSTLWLLDVRVCKEWVKNVK